MGIHRNARRNRPLLAHCCALNGMSERQDLVGSGLDCCRRRGCRQSSTCSEMLRASIDLDAEIANSAFKLRVTEKQLHRPQIPRLFVNLRNLSSQHRMHTVCQTVKRGAAYPPANNPCVLPRRNVRLALEPAGKQISRTRVAHAQPIVDGRSGLSGQPELDGPPSFPLCDSSAIGDAVIQAQTSSACNRTRSQPRSLLSIARLNNARSRLRSGICMRTRIAKRLLAPADALSRRCALCSTAEAC